MSNGTLDSSTIATDGETFRRFNGGGLNSCFDEGIMYGPEMRSNIDTVCRSENRERAAW